VLRGLAARAREGVAVRLVAGAGDRGPRPPISASDLEFMGAPVPGEGGQWEMVIMHDSEGED
jgi:hypothetical protein